MTKPEDPLMMGPYPAWDLEDLESNYKVHKLWEAADRAAFLSRKWVATFAPSPPVVRSAPAQPL